jgi:hypothetical protein
LERRKEMLPKIKITNAVRKPGRLLCVVPVGLVLFMVALPTYAANPHAKGAEAPDATCPAGGQCFADVPPGNPFYEFVNRIYVQGLVTGYACGGLGEPCDAQNRPYYRPGATVSRQQMAKFLDQARSQPGIHIETGTASIPIFSRTTANSIYSAGVSGSSDTGRGLYGTSVNGTGVYGVSANGVGVYGMGGGGWSWAGYFNGNVYVTGNVQVAGTCCGAGAGSFKIDHPLDPANKYLRQSSVESADMKTVYDGNVTLDARGEAEVVLPDYVEALNDDFRYQLTAIGAPGPNLYIAEEIGDNRFKVAGGEPGMKVSWLVTGIRRDPYAEAHRIRVEEDKPLDERGKYLHPTEWGMPESMGVDHQTGQRLEQMEHRAQNK